MATESQTNGGRAHYVIESKVQWKPFWLATFLYPQNDWLGGNFPYTMTLAHGPHSRTYEDETIFTSFTTARGKCHTFLVSFSPKDTSPLFSWIDMYAWNSFPKTICTGAAETGNELKIVSDVAKTHIQQYKYWIKNIAEFTLRTHTEKKTCFNVEIFFMRTRLNGTVLVVATHTETETHTAKKSHLHFRLVDECSVCFGFAHTIPLSVQNWSIGKPRKRCPILAEKSQVELFLTGNNAIVSWSGQVGIDWWWHRSIPTWPDQLMMALYVEMSWRPTFTTRQLLSLQSHLLCRVNRVLRSTPRLSEIVSFSLPHLTWTNDKFMPTWVSMHVTGRDWASMPKCELMWRSVFQSNMGTCMFTKLSFSAQFMILCIDHMSTNDILELLTVYPFILRGSILTRWFWLTFRSLSYTHRWKSIFTSFQKILSSTYLKRFFGDRKSIKENCTPKS